MSYLRFDSANFTLGELDPRCYARVDSEIYYKTAKRVRNCICIPQGGIDRRWGTTYVDAFTDITNANPIYVEIATLVYNDNVIYLIAVSALQFNIYLENILVATVSTPYAQEDIAGLRFTQVENRIVVTNENFTPYQLIRSASTANVISGVDSVNNYITVTTAMTPGQILPIQFTTSGALPTTSPQIYVARDYFIRVINANNVRVFNSTADAAANVNFFIISSAGSGTNNVVPQNTWTFSAITFENKPAFDFNGGYAAITFTPSAVSGATVTITASGAIFTAAMVGGVYSGNGGILRIQTFTDSTHVIGFTVEPFADTSAIQGQLSFLGEPAWSTARGFPRCATFFQQRLVLAGSPSIPNGVWLSVSNNAYDFDDSNTLADDAISWYPAGGSISFIRALTSCRTLLVHTNTGNFSTPLSTEVPVTPTNFTLTEQNKDGITDIQPIFIDNQLIFVDASGNNVKNMIWEITQSSWVLNNISVTASILTKNPTDLTAFAENLYTDGAFVFFVNDDGTLAVFQTLHEQNVAAWSLSNTIQTYTSGNFVHATAAINKCWFVVQRYIATAQVGTNITSFSAVNDTLTSGSHGLTLNAANYITFTTTGSLPITVPPITTTTYYWARGVTSSTFKVYGSEADANADANAYDIDSAGTNSKIVYWPFQPQLYIEQLDFTVEVDCAIKFANINSTTVTGLNPLIGESVQIFADGLVWANQTVFNNQITNSDVINTGYVGLQYVSTFSPLPINNILGDGNNLYKPKHIKNLYINYYQTVGATVDGYDIPTQTINQVTFGEIPVPADGVFPITLMNGWNSFEFDIQIQQTLPLPMTILGIGYELEV